MGTAVKCQVERYLTGKETEPWEILYFKVYRSELQVVEKALETAGLMLRTYKSRGYCRQMICADFLAGTALKKTSGQFPPLGTSNVTENPKRPHGSRLGES